MNEILNHYQLNHLLKEILLYSFSFIKNNVVNFSNDEIKILKQNNKESKKEKELYEKFLKSINSKLDDCLDTR